MHRTEPCRLVLGGPREWPSRHCCSGPQRVAGNPPPIVRVLPGTSGAGVVVGSIRRCHHGSCEMIPIMPDTPCRLDSTGSDPSFVCERVCTSDRLMRRLGGLAKVRTLGRGCASWGTATRPPCCPRQPLCFCNNLHAAFPTRPYRMPPQTRASRCAARPPRTPAPARARAPSAPTSTRSRPGTIPASSAAAASACAGAAPDPWRPPCGGAPFLFPPLASLSHATLAMHS